MRSAPTLLLTICLLVAGAHAEPVNIALFGDFETPPWDDEGTRPAEVWHRGGSDYTPAFPDWVLTREQPANGQYALTTTSDREFVTCAEGEGGIVRATVCLRAAKPNTKATLRLSWWRRRVRKDTQTEVTVGREWEQFEIETEALQGGPIELGVALLDSDAQLWADDITIVAEPLADQHVEIRRIGEQETEHQVEPVRAIPIDLSARQRHEGQQKGRNGIIEVTVDVPESCLQLPYTSGGIPFPRGALFQRHHVRVIDAAGNGVPSQCDVLARWHADDSIKVLLVTVPTPAATTKLSLSFGPDQASEPIPDPLTVVRSDEGAQIRTGVTNVRLQHGRGLVRVGPLALGNPVTTMADGRRCTVQNADARIELSGPLRTVVALRGRLRGNDAASSGRFVTRYTFWRGSSRTLVQHCWICDERATRTPIRDATFTITGLPSTPIPDGLMAPFQTRRASIADPSRTPSTSSSSTGTRPPGLLGPLAIRDFWQNHPIGVTREDQQTVIHLWPGTVKGVLIPQGFARQWEWLVDTGGKPLQHAFQTTALPLLHAVPDWGCSSGVFEFVLPPAPETFPIFEQRVGSLATLGRFSAASKESSGLYGVFNYGDAPGDGGWSNLESMAAHELFLHWIRTGSREHADAARLAAEHYRDVDIHHGIGFCHTHCNNHVQTGQGWSHSWIQGVRDLYFLFGDLRALDVLQEVGERLLTKPVGWTTGRDWTRPIDNLVDIAGATGDQRYVDCARKHIEELGRRQIPAQAVCGAERDSWYQDRYQAGCAFTWYGCQAMAKLHAETDDDTVLAILRRELDLSLDVQTKAARAHVVLPRTAMSHEKQACTLANPYALGRGSTLFPPLGYLAATTGDRKYLELGLDILAHYMLNLRGGSDASATSYATVFLHYAKQAGIGAPQEAQAFARARAFSYEQWPEGLLNGDFEADNFQGWSVKKVPGQNHYYDELVHVGYYLDEDVNRSGKRSLRLHSDNRSRTMGVKGHAGLKPKTQWRVSIWMKADDSMNPSASLSLREYDTDQRTSAALRPAGERVGGWQQRAAEFTTSDRTVATLALSNRTGTGDAWFDDARIEDLGPALTLFTNNGDRRDWRKPAYPGLGIDSVGSYVPDEPMTGDIKVNGRPITFAEGCLTDGVSKYDHRQKPNPSYCYWTKRSGGTITFDLGAPRALRLVKVHTLQGGRKAHGTQRIELHKDGPDGELLGSIEPVAEGWSRFDGLSAVTQKLTLVLTAMKGRAYTTLSEVEIWGED
ncbi:MAG: hypothetical protein HN742_16090 [Lentisphaerae bacterium]|jgi:hypothetical protein|nr:hypothetical protein [Lentisphaerota bacterium]MBT4817823.1 hypothetical protein [Lentisphaerota bacterium]MBT5604810.1 hypothetical protein [Lentisphaerota bacterium]MBT7053561.1 hypothetical protein [Lentisphaerota bacterium]MBT7843398.1 hypothetical protein [Lentisphaerota bacterium]